jgi:hypothetical protein
MMSTSKNAVVSSPQVVACEFGSGVALLDLAGNTYFSLNDVGAFIWEQIRTPLLVSEIVDRVTATYDVEPARCVSDVQTLLSRLETAGLIRWEQAEHAG